MKKKILFICGSKNQTMQMHEISMHLQSGYDCYFSPHYASGHVEFLRRIGFAEMSIMGKKAVANCFAYLYENNLAVDDGGKENDYDLVVTCADIVIPKNIQKKKIILVQEGMTDPENLPYYLAKYKLLPRWAASTATMGLSHAYEKFCVASEGYKDLFIKKGIRPETIVVSGIPNFDNCKKYLKNNFPHRDFVLVCTSDARETLKYENRKKTILNAVKIAAGRQLIFKLHPNENAGRATREIDAYAPGSLVYAAGTAEEMIANCSVLITQYSSTVYVGIALGKEVYSNFPMDVLRTMVPIQNNSAAFNIAEVCSDVLKQQQEKVLDFSPAPGFIKKLKRIKYKEKFAQLFAKAS